MNWIKTNGSDLTNSSGELTSHLNGIFYKNINFLEHGIFPIYVFDGKPPKIKDYIAEKRRAIKEKSKKKIEMGENIDINEKRAFKIEKNHVDNCKILLDLMGLCYCSR